LARARKGSARKEPEPKPQITSVFVQGFKSIRDRTEIELRPLTLLAGRNSSGKSSIMQALLLLKQTLDAPIDPGPMKLDGENVTFSSAEQMFWRGRPKRATEIEVGIKKAGHIAALFFRKSAHGVALDRLEYNDLARRHSWGRGTLREGMANAAFPLNLTHKLGVGIAAELGRSELRVERRRCLLLVSHWYTPMNQPEAGGVVASFNPASPISGLVARMLHLPGHRGNPARAYPSTQVGAAFPGVFQPYAASIVALWEETKDARLEQLGGLLAELGLTSHVNARRLDDTRVEIQVGRLAPNGKGGAKDLVNIADVGFGVSQTLPLLIALLVAEPGQLVYIEQPEIHLHPHAQVTLAKCLLDAAKRGVIVVAETHSHLLLKGVQIEVASGKADPKLVKLHWFERTKEGATRVSSADLDAQGTFGPWPEDFADVELDAEEKFLRASLRGAPE
jgi:hypothetical protein